MSGENSSKRFTELSLYPEKRVNPNRAKKWLREGRRNLLIVAIVGALLISGTALALNGTELGRRWGSSGQESFGGDGNIDVEPVENYFLADKDEYDGVLLGKTDDAGESYIKDTLFIGDSNTLRMNMYGLLSLQNVIGVEGMGIYGALYNNCVYFQGQTLPVTIADAVKMMKPRRCIIGFGTNDLVGFSADAFTGYYRDFIKGIQQAYPYADIIIAAVPPFAKSFEKNGFKIATVTEFNRALLDLCKEMGLHFLDTGEALTDSDGYIRSAYVYADGLHLTKEGLEALFKYARTHAYETEDTRPKPLGTIPTRRPAPVIPKEPEEEEEEEAVFDPTIVTGSVLSLLKTSGFTPAEKTTDMTGATYYTVTVNIAECEPGDEGAVASSVYNNFVTKSKLTGGTVAVSYSVSGEQYKFSVGVLNNAVPACTHPATHDEVITSPTCIATGVSKRICTTCGATVNPSVTIPALGHTWGAWSPPLNCGQTGEQTRTCSICGQQEIATHTNTNAHNYVNGFCVNCGAADPSGGGILPPP